MLALLSPRLWLAIALAGALAFSHFTAYRSGKASVRAEWNVEKLAQAETVRLQLMQRDRDQSELNNKVRTVDANLQKQKALRAAADVGAGKLRDALSAALDRAAAGDTAPASGVDAADPRAAIAGQCVRELVALAAAHGRLADQARALQAYANSLRAAP